MKTSSILTILAVALIALIIIAMTSSCSSDNDNKQTGPGDITAKYDPFAQDDTDKAIELDIDAEELEGVDWVEAQPVPYSGAGEFAAGVKSTGTYGVRNGNRQAFRTFPMFRGGTAIVVFSDRPREGYRVQLGRANRISSGPHNGFVVKNSKDKTNTFAHSPYGRHPSRITYHF